MILRMKLSDGRIYTALLEHRYSEKTIVRWPLSGKMTDPKTSVIKKLLEADGHDWPSYSRWQNYNTDPDYFEISDKLSDFLEVFLKEPTETISDVITAAFLHDGVIWSYLIAGALKSLEEYDNTNRRRMEQGSSRTLGLHRRSYP